jgi:hypothetical protein
MRGKVVATILLVAGCQTAATPNGEPAEPGEVAALQQAAGTSSQNVTVVNSASNPVPVSGTVAATQSGPWNMSLAPGGIVNIGNIPTVSLTPGTAVNVGTVLNPVSISSLPDVNIANFPATQAVSGTVAVSNLPATQAVSGTVTVANLPSTQTVSGTVAVSSLPSVSISGTPSVSISGTPSVKPMKTTSLLFSNTVGIQGDFADLDVSGCDQVRIYAQGDGGNFVLTVTAHDPSGLDGVLDTFADTDGLPSRVYDAPGTKLRLNRSGNALLTVSVYCR